MMKHVLTLDGATLGAVRPKKARKPRSTNRPTKDLQPGQCMCVLNTRTQRGVTACRQQPSGPGRLGKIKFKGPCPNPVR